MQAQLFPRGTYAPTMGVFTLAQGGPSHGMANDLQPFFTSAPTTPSTKPLKQSRATTTQAMPRFSAAQYASMNRASSPPASQSSHDSSSSSSTSDESDEETTCNPTVSGKLSRAFKNLRRIGGKQQQ
ncbi:hypothetical protein FRB91_001527 [Serendipita sp. 411]|nr:hypothetical protein FRB91_001527 [Serendipita sp. 411]